MGLLDNTTHLEYYQGNDYGNYQFVSLDDIITQFQIMYVGEDKLIPKAKRADIAFHAQRALAELSFDTFKSFKSQQIDVPPSLTMILPHDYVNYTKVSWADSAGIKRPIYHTRHTSNPFQIKQEEGGEYSFGGGFIELLQNASFDSTLEAGGPWSFTDAYVNTSIANTTGTSNVSIVDGSLTFRNASHRYKTVFEGTTMEPIFGVAQACWQPIDVSAFDQVTLLATATSTATGTQVAASGVSYATPNTTVRIGISTSPGSMEIIGANTGVNGVPESPNLSTDNFIGFESWTSGETGEKAITVDVSNYTTVYALIVSIAPWTTHSGVYTELFVNTTVDSVSVQTPNGGMSLVSPEGNEMNSSTWNAYSSNVPSEDSIQDYRYEQHWLNPNERYGLHPEHAQINGSFYIDDRLGRIHFSSNISGKTVILDYISDSLGTDAEMQVPKLAEDAMYKHILYDVISTRSNIGGGRLSFHKREKFAAVRKAKLRLSNIKLEELTQILRGQSKIIKH
mgnify:FL=1